MCFMNSCSIFVTSTLGYPLLYSVCNRIHAFNILAYVTRCHSLPQSRMPQNFLETQVEFHNTDEGFRHNKKEETEEEEEEGG